MSGFFVIIGLCLLAAVFIVLVNTVKENENSDGTGEYDERQFIIRGKGYRLGFFMYVIELSAVMILQLSGFDLPFSKSALIVILFALPIVVFSVYCILNDVYVGRKKSLKDATVILAIVVISNLVSAVRIMKNNKMIVNGKLSDECVTPVIAFSFAIILIVLLVHNYRARHLEESEDEES